MGSDGSITACLQRLKAGDRGAAQLLWERYFRRLVGLARARLHGSPAAADAAEDVALSAFDSVYRRAELGQYQSLDDRGNLWSLLFVVTVRKAIDHARREGRRTDRRGPVTSLSDLDERDLAEVLGPEPTPELAAQVAEECRRLLGLLHDETLRSVAFWKMEGYTNREIAGRLGVVEETVERKLRRIRQAWSSEVEQ